MSNGVPKGWSIKPLSELATVDANSLKSSTSPGYRFHYIDIASVKTGRVDIPAETITYSQAPSRARKIVRKGDVLMSNVRPNLQAFAYFDQEGDDFVASTGFSVITARKICDGKFIYHSILADDVTRQIAALVSGSNYPAISSSNVKNLDLVAPPLPEQKKIAAILSSVDDVIEKTRAQIDKLKDLKTGMMQELLTKGIGPGGVPHTEFKDSPVGRIPTSWSVRLLRDVCERVCVGFVGTCERHYRASGVPMIRTGNLKDGNLDLTGVRHVTDEFHKKEKKSQLRSGDLLIARHGSHGSACLVPENLGEANCLNVVIVRPSQTVAMPLFLKYVFNSGAMKASFGAKSEGSTQSVISTTEIAKTAFPIPPIAEQREISAALSAVDGRIEFMGKKLSSSLALKKSLMQDLLTGKVRVNVDNKEPAAA